MRRRTASGQTGAVVRSGVTIVGAKPWRPPCRVQADLPTDEKVLPEIHRETAALYRGYASGLHRFAASLTRDAGMVEEAVQETFLRYFVARRRGAAIRDPQAWLFRVARNYVYDCLKRSASRRTVALDEARGCVDPQQNAEMERQAVETRNAIAAALTPRECECLRLRMEGLRHRQIAEILRIRTGTVSVLLARALNTVRNIRDRKE